MLIAAIPIQATVKIQFRIAKIKLARLCAQLIDDTSVSADSEVLTSTFGAYAGRWEP